MEPDAHLEVISERSHALLDAATGATELRVPSCPDWTVADLVLHIGTLWGWVAEIVTAGARAELGEQPTDRSDGALIAWAGGKAAAVLAALGAADPGADCWTFGLPHTTRFWFRRQALETTLHARDVEVSVGAVSRIDSELAADGVDEHLDVMVPRLVRMRPEAWNGETLHLHRTDGEGEWVVRLGPNGEVATERAHSKADLALRGNAEGLWLWCTNRATPGDLGLERLGDEEIAKRWRKEMAF